MHLCLERGESKIDKINTTRLVLGAQFLIRIYFLNLN
jgi:hypothetical protein